MPAILENPEVRHRVTPMSAETYRHLYELGLIDEKNELLDGIVVKKIPKSPQHVWLVNKMAGLLRAAAGPGLAVRQEAPLTFTKLSSEPEPDAAVVEGHDDAFIRQHPVTALLLVEVCVSSEETDRAKALIYARSGVPEYWLILAERAEVEILRVPSSEGYAERRVFRRGESAPSTALPGLRVAVDDLFPAA